MGYAIGLIESSLRSEDIRKSARALTGREGSERSEGIRKSPQDLLTSIPLTSAAKPICKYLEQCILEEGNKALYG